MSLGKQLAALRREENEKQLAAQREQDALLSREEAEALAAVRAFFYHAKSHVIHSLTNGEIPTPVRLGYRWHNLASDALRLCYWNNPSAWVDKPAHRYYGVWLEFVAWAAENELRVSWEYCHDGVGIESWMVLHINPSESGELA